MPRRATVRLTALARTLGAGHLVTFSQEPSGRWFYWLDGRGIGITAREADGKIRRQAKRIASRRIPVTNHTTLEERCAR